jgi:hypothetical protein
MIGFHARRTLPSSDPRRAGCVTRLTSALLHNPGHRAGIGHANPAERRIAGSSSSPAIHSPREWFSRLPRAA